MTLREAIHYHCSQLNAVTNVGIHFSYSQEQPELTERVKIQCFLCFREAINNALTHARASRIDVNFDVRSDDTLRLRICDGGGGLRPDVFQSPSGLGLAMIRERTEGIGGLMDIISDPDRGTAISLVVPLERQSVFMNMNHTEPKGSATEVTQIGNPPVGGLFES